MVSAQTANKMCNNLEEDGITGGRQLASTQSLSSFKTLNNLCCVVPYDGSLCWIGLILEYNTNTGNLSYSWFDHTEVNVAIFDSLWCDGYPIYVNNYSFKSYTSYTYINTSHTCTQNTKSENELHQNYLCGPRTSQSFGYVGLQNVFFQDL